MWLSRNARDSFPKKSKPSMITKKNLVVLLAVCMSFLAIQATMAQVPSKEQQAKRLEYKLIEAAENTWGYDILMDGKLFIHQPFAPGVSGNQGFSTKEKASSAAELVIKPTATS
jgi:hypothetical protein